MNSKLSDYIGGLDPIKDNIYKFKNSDGYWSNLSKDENTNLMTMLETCSTEKCIDLNFPRFKEIIFSEKRAAGLELLNLKGDEIAVDFGCMWGALSIPLAKMVGSVVGIDQTLESLKFSSKRAKEQDIENINFIQSNLRDICLPEQSIDIAIVNGVLEWLPEIDPIVVDDYWYGTNSRSSGELPRNIQLSFLTNIHNSLSNNGKLYLAIENRYDYKMFFGDRDPHSGLLFTTIFPKKISNLISKIIKKREYRPWIYSFNEMQSMLSEAGFTKIETYSVWPDYRLPDHITPYGYRNNNFTPISARRKNGEISIKRLIANRLEWLFFKKLNLQYFSPSMILVAHK